MWFSDNEYKFVAVLNSKIEIPKLMNAIGHMSVWLTNSAENNNEFKFLEYKDKDWTLHPNISNYPFIVLKSKNSNQIRTLREKAIEEWIIYSDFTDTMLGASSDEQVSNTANTPESELEYFGVCLFWTQEQLAPLTKKFSVFR